MKYNEIYLGKTVCYQRQKAIVRNIGTYTPTLRHIVDWVLGKGDRTTEITIELKNGTEKKVPLGDLAVHFSR